jgi:hypothetical protein
MAGGNFGAVKNFNTHKTKNVISVTQQFSGTVGRIIVTSLPYKKIQKHSYKSSMLRSGHRGYHFKKLERPIFFQKNFM